MYYYAYIAERPDRWTIKKDKHCGHQSVLYAKISYIKSCVEDANDGWGELTDFELQEYKLLLEEYPEYFI